MQIKDEEARCEKEGLVSLRNIRRQRTEEVSESGYYFHDEVYVKIVQIRDDGKLSLSIKDVD